jgi:RNA polymerase sigma-70 factor (ECF subfamily)
LNLLYIAAPAINPYFRKYGQLLPHSNHFNQFINYFLLFQVFSFPDKNKKSKIQESDEVIFQRFREFKSQKDFEILFTRYAHILLGFALKYLKDQDSGKSVVLRSFTILSTYQGEISLVKSWLYSVVKNECLQEIRKQNRKIFSENDEVPDMESDNDWHLIGEENSSSLEVMVLVHMEKLSEGQKKCIQLFYLKRLSYKEIEAQTGLPYNTVKSHIQNGLRKLRLILADIEH